MLNGNYYDAISYMEVGSGSNGSVYPTHQGKFTTQRN